MKLGKYMPRGLEFTVLDLIAVYQYKTATSIGFSLGRYTDGRKPAASLQEAARGGVFECQGTLVVHHPCEGDYEVRITVVLRSQDHDWQVQHEAMRPLFAALEIPKSATYFATFITPGEQSAICSDSPSLH
jgi:hypothetical protein